MRPRDVIASIRLRAPLILAVLVLALSPGMALGAPPTNNDFADAASVPINSPASGTNVEATTEAGEPQPCDVTTVATIWYRIRGTGGPVTLNTVGSDPDTVLAVYDTDGGGTGGPPADANRIACTNDIWDGGNAQDDRASELVFPTEEGIDYLVQIGSCSGCGGSLPATGGVEFIAYDPPDNDDRASAPVLAAGRGVLTENRGATTEPGERAECGAEHQYGKTVWFRFNAGQSGTAVFTTGGGFDAVMAVYRGGTHLGCNDDGVIGAVGPSRLALHLDPGEYLIQVGGWGDDIRAAYGEFSVQVDFVADPQPDRDGDGITDAADRCPDQSSRARDADSDGCLDPPPPPPLKNLRSTVSSLWVPSRRSTRVQVLAVNALPKGATVKVTCSSKPRRRCPRSRTYRIRKATKKLNVRKPFRGKRLPAGTRVTIVITAPGYEGKVYVYRMRKKKRPSLRQLCLPPGATRPGTCL
jgi:hypothetical protein